MKRVILFLIVLLLISLVSAEYLSPSQSTEVRVAVVNGTPASPLDSGDGGGGDSSGSSSGENLEEQELCRESWECDEWGECESFLKSRKNWGWL